MTIMIETERLILKTSTAENFQQVFALLSDADVMRYVGNGARTEDEVQNGLAMMIKHQAKYGFAFGDIYLKESQEFIGRAGLIYLGMNEEQDEIEVGYQLHKKYWGKGYATEIAKGLVEWGFDALKLTQIVAVVQFGNQASRHVLEKAGLKYVGDTKYFGKEVWKFRIMKG